MSRCARERRVFFFEEPIFDKYRSRRLELTLNADGVSVAVPHFPAQLEGERLVAAQKEMIDELFLRCEIHDYVLWYYTPMAMPFTRHLNPLATIYDCMDELSAFRGAPPDMRAHEEELISRADAVFTGGRSLYEAKRARHWNVHAFPSSIEVEHFAQARVMSGDPTDQADIPHPRLGFMGVIDERMNVDLIKSIAQANPDWHVVLIGPIVKIDPGLLPEIPNVHLLGAKLYQELPSYLAGWDVALLPFAKNESTRFISPTKTPEYLAASKPVVSTSVRDVVTDYGDRGLVWIADTPEEFTAAIHKCLHNSSDRPKWLSHVDSVLGENSWGRTWGRMMSLMETAIEQRNRGGRLQPCIQLRPGRECHRTGGIIR
jgi:UDP-galactopyranose mutase